MVARLVLDGQAVAFGDELAIAQREIVGCVVEDVVATPLRFEQEREGGIAPDVEAMSWPAESR